MRNRKIEFFCQKIKKNNSHQNRKIQFSVKIIKSNFSFKTVKSRFNQKCKIMFFTKIYIKNVFHQIFIFHQNHSGMSFCWNCKIMFFFIKITKLGFLQNEKKSYHVLFIFYNFYYINHAIFSLFEDFAWKLNITVL